jgi:trk system potassium uptake protein TrkH
MGLNWNIILRVTGALFVVIGFAMIPALITAKIYNEQAIIEAFLKTIIPSIFFGGLLISFNKQQERKTKIRDGYMIVALCWILASAIAAVPFVISGEITNPIDAFFETSSGFSTTGASILTDVEVMSKGLLFWRSFTHWLGGMGILLFAIALLPSLGISGQAIAKAETPSPTLDKLTPKLSDTAKMLYLLYLCFTLAETILLKLGGLSLFDSLVHTFGTVGTGGFSSYNDSVAHFGSAYVDIVISIFMILSGINFNLYFIIIRQNIKNFFRDAELKLFLLIVAVSTVFIGVDLFATGTFNSLQTSLRYSLFQTATIISTTGFATSNFDLWPTFCKMVLLILMFIGSCSSSTGGGIKIIRILVILKLIKRGISLKLHPTVISSLRFGDKSLPVDAVSAIANFVFLYITTIFVGTILVSIDGFNLMTNFSAVVACLGNIGPGFDLVGPIMNYSIFSNGPTLLLSFLMLAGRLELFTIFILLTPRFWNPNR